MEGESDVYPSYFQAPLTPPPPLPPHLHLFFGLVFGMWVAFVFWIWQVDQLWAAFLLRVLLTSA